MSQVNITLHFAFSTKNRIPYLENSLLSEHVFKHIRLFYFQKKIFIIEINGWTNHSYVLLNLPSTQQICDVVQQIKENLPDG
ncbi:MAG: hypothetical protein GC180_09105 [Bacteroidetes bacterium]|nr:hypothetical protein [Bacteroidota bacterium]